MVHIVNITVCTHVHPICTKSACGHMFFFFSHQFQVFINYSVVIHLNVLAWKWLNYYYYDLILLIRNGYADVVNYLLRTGHVQATMKDLDNKGLLFTAVMNNQPKVLKFLLSHVSIRMLKSYILAVTSLSCAIDNAKNVRVTYCT